jgi:preprotein translocase subunit SecD
MTTTSSVEDRLRRTFRAVAEQPVAPFALGGDLPTGGRRSPTGRRTALVVAAAVVIVALGTVAIVYGPRSSPPGSRAPATSQQGGTVAAFVPTSPRVTTRLLAEDAKILTRRLTSLGDSADTAVVRGRSVVVLGGRRLPVPASTLAASGTVDFRPALCTSAPFTPPTAGGAVGRVPDACSSPEYSLGGAILLPEIPSDSTNSASTPADPTLAAVPTSTPAYDESHAGSPVLVPLLSGGGERYLLGRAVLAGTAVAAAVVSYHTPEWVVDVDFTGPGSTDWDVVARRFFHEILTIDFDGQVVSAPVIEPTQARFNSFDGRLEISGNFTRRSAEILATDLNSGPLVTPLTPMTRKTVSR